MGGYGEVAFVFERYTAVKLLSCLTGDFADVETNWGRKPTK